jgi:hypothetical protein
MMQGRKRASRKRVALFASFDIIQAFKQRTNLVVVNAGDYLSLFLAKNDCVTEKDTLTAVEDSTTGVASQPTHDTAEATSTNSSSDFPTCYLNLTSLVVSVLYLQSWTFPIRSTFLALFRYPRGYRR